MDLDTTFANIETGKSAMAVMGLKGDTKCIWDKTKPVEVEAARAQFGSLRAAGYAAFRVKDADGAKGEIMHEFDPNAERVIMVPPLAGG